MIGTCRSLKLALEKIPYLGVYWMANFGCFYGRNICVKSFPLWVGGKNSIMTTHELRSDLERIYPIAWQIRYDRALLIVKLSSDGRFTDINSGDRYNEALYRYLNNLPPAHSKAGYCVNCIAQNSTDLLFLTDDVLQSQYRDLQTILLHELAHCLIETGEDNIITLTEQAQLLGSQFYNCLNPGLEQVTRHTEHFCQILAFGAINFNTTMSLPERPFFPTSEDCMRSALRFESLWEG